MFTCVIRYRVEPSKLAEFREYVQAWIGLIRKYGGTHHGYFVPGTDNDSLPDPSFSFPGLGAAAPADVAFALFSFPDVEAYDQYRAAVAEDEGCKAATVRFNETKCFLGYERSFLVPIFDCGAGAERTKSRRCCPPTKTASDMPRVSGLISSSWRVLDKLIVRRRVGRTQMADGLPCVGFLFRCYSDP